MLNNFSAIGRLVANPVIEKMGDKNVTTFSIYINEFYKDGLELNKRVHTIPCVTDGRIAELAGEFLKKNLMVGITGSIITLDKGLGCRVREMEFLSSKD